MPSRANRSCGLGRQSTECPVYGGTDTDVSRRYCSEFVQRSGTGWLGLESAKNSAWHVSKQLLGSLQGVALTTMQIAAVDRDQDQRGCAATTMATTLTTASGSPASIRKHRYSTLAQMRHRCFRLCKTLGSDDFRGVGNTNVAFQAVDVSLLMDAFAAQQPPTATTATCDVIVRGTFCSRLHHHGHRTANSLPITDQTPGVFSLRLSRRSSRSCTIGRDLLKVVRNAKAPDPLPLMVPLLV